MDKIKKKEKLKTKFFILYFLPFSRRSFVLRVVAANVLSMGHGVYHIAKTFFHSARGTDRMTSLRDVHGGRFLFSWVLWGVATPRTWCAASRHNDVCLNDGNTRPNRIGTGVCVAPSISARLTNTIKSATPQESQRISWRGGGFLPSALCIDLRNQERKEVDN